MNAPTIGAIGIVALLLAGCETLNGPQAVANAEAQREECKVTSVTSTSESLRLQNQKGADTDAMQRSEGALALGRVRKNEPNALRDSISPQESLTSKALRNC